jgi:hypothetical protein
VRTIASVTERERTHIEELLERQRGRSSFLTLRQCAGGWREAFGEAAARVPVPYRLYGEDEGQPVALGFPLRVSTKWEAFCRRIDRLANGEAAYRLALLRGETFDKAPLVEQRRSFAAELAELLENALAHDHGQRLPELLWLVVSREIASSVASALHSVSRHLPPHRHDELDTVRFAIGERLADIIERAESDAVARLRRVSGREPDARPLALGRILRQDLLPLVVDEAGESLQFLDAAAERHLRVPRQQFGQLTRRAAEELARLYEKDVNFRHALAAQEPDAGRLTPERLLLAAETLRLLEFWNHPEAPRLVADQREALRRLGRMLTRLEVACTLRRSVLPATDSDGKLISRLANRLVTLSPSTRPLDFTRPGVADSAVRRYGLLFDLAEFTQQLEEIRHRGHLWEEQGLLSMTRFLEQVEEIRARHRLKFEKFLGDGAFYSARSARPLLLAAAELRILYERLRHQGFPFDRGLRLAVNVGTYHLVPMTTRADDRPHFEFFGHALVELVRLTTGKTTKEVEDITDFLLAAGYDINRVLEFLEPVRHEARAPEHARERPYAAFVAENGELVNRGCVITETFLVDLETEYSGAALSRFEAYGLSWLAVPVEPDHPEGPWIGLRLLGSARLKGIEPGTLVEMVVLDQLPPGAETLPSAAMLVQSLHRLAGGWRDAEPSTAPPAEERIDPHLCVASTVGPSSTRAWFIGLYSAEQDALLHAHRVPLPGDRGGAPRGVAVPPPRRARHALPRPVPELLRRHHPPRGAAAAQRLLHLSPRHPASRPSVASGGPQPW